VKTGFKRLTMVMCAAMVMLYSCSGGGDNLQPSWMKGSVMKLEDKLVSKYGEEQTDEIKRGLDQVSRFWREEDGNSDLFEKFVLDNYAGKPAMRDAMFERFEVLFEQIEGHMNQITLALRAQADLALGTLYPFDRIFAGYSPASHIKEDFFKNKLAFVALLNFPLTTLPERLEEGGDWTRRQWAEVRLAQKFSKRIPAEVQLAIGEAGGESDSYIASYNIWMHHLLNNDGERLFPPKMRLLSHWNLRDEIKADYEDEKHGLEKQKMIQKVMERIVDQTIPEIVIDNPHVDWNPFTNEVSKAEVNDSGRPAPEDLKVTNDREPDTRYRILMNTFKAVKKADPYSPAAPTHIERSFNENREIPEERARKMLVDIVSSPLVKDVADIIRKRLGRPLQPFDIWYNGFRSQSGINEEELDRIVGEKYPTAEAFDRDIPNMLRKLDFSPERADYLGDNIVVENARGSGHAWGAEMKSGKAHLRTRVGQDGMDYKGFNIAVHEMGHNVEQTFSLKNLEHTLLKGVPNTAFTEAFAFTFQAHDLMLLGVEGETSEKREAMKVLDDFWGTYEIAGVSLVDIRIWHWMYDNPQASKAELRKAVLKIAGDVWNNYYAPVFGMKDEYILAVYSHIIHSFLYTPDYPIGQMIALQIKKKMKEAGKIGPEFERMAVMGRVTPDLWMKNATGSSVGADAMLKAAEEAVLKLKQ